LAHAHKVGAPVLAAAEGFRQNYNYWLGQMPPGATAFIDLSRIATADGTPPFEKNWDFYTQADNPHPATPELYGAWASVVTSVLAGI
jgi:hypothetical protein